MDLPRVSRRIITTSRTLRKLLMLQETSSGSVKIISLDRERLLARLKIIAARIYADHPDVVSVRLFGSVARGDQVGLSDVDILVVVREKLPNPLVEIQRFYPYFDLPVGVDILVYSEPQIQAGLQKNDPFISQVWAESLDLCGERQVRESIYDERE
ncbi:nucleotidyltransferase domain-containing protein [Candidatus Parcubacteria bacterium]|nr:MAG: nucleotidyltransferase domain-containing protein [Candidatus Parcubacteria bacterium]